MSKKKCLHQPIPSHSQTLAAHSPSLELPYASEITVKDVKEIA